jgi:hypothetical protein
MITFTKSPTQNFIRSTCQARTRQAGSLSTFAIVCARIPLWGFGTFNPGMTFSGEMFKTGQAAGSPQPAFTYNSVWPNIYNTLTETWTETYGGTQTITTAYSRYADVVKTVSTSSSGPFYGDGTITSFSVTSALVTINYTFTLYLNPGNPLQGTTFTGVYTGQLSGSLLNPGGAGPFNPSDPTYGWAELTGLANNLLGSATIPGIGSYSEWLTIDPISTAPGYRISTNYYNSSTLWEAIAAAAYGFPTGISFDQVQHLPPSILDWPTPSPNSQPTGSVQNQGACLCMKSTWNLNGAGWGNPAVDPGINNPPPTGLGQVMNDHASLFAQQIELANFNSAGSVKPATTIQNPIAWPKTVTFNPADVTSNLGAGQFGLLGFQALPR